MSHKEGSTKGNGNAIGTTINIALIMALTPKVAASLAKRSCVISTHMKTEVLARLSTFVKGE